MTAWRTYLKFNNGTTGYNGRIGIGESCQWMLKSNVFARRHVILAKGGGGGGGHGTPGHIAKVLRERNSHFQVTAQCHHVEGENRYAHITRNLPLGEHLRWQKLQSSLQGIHEQMGYGEQALVMVTATPIPGTNHVPYNLRTNVERIWWKVPRNFIVTEGNVATQRYLEKKSSPYRPLATYQNSKRELPIYRLPEQQFGRDHAPRDEVHLFAGLLSGILQKHKCEVFGSWQNSYKPITIENKETKNYIGKDRGGLWPWPIRKGYRIPVHQRLHRDRSLSGPKHRKVLRRQFKIQVYFDAPQTFAETK